LRSWLFYLAFSLRQQARARILVWTSFGLLALAALVVHVNTRVGRWNLEHVRVTLRTSESTSLEAVRVRYGEVLATVEFTSLLANALGPGAGPSAVAAALRGAMFEGASLRIFVGAVVVNLLSSLLVPLWTLTFAGESLGRFRDNRSLSWLLMRPLPRPAIYLGSYLAALPWCLALNLGGYAILCLLGGDPGHRALGMFWPAILLGTLAFAALFQLLSVTFKRAGILGLLYVFFFEMIAGNMPGQQKRLCISYYVRSLIVDRMSDEGAPLDLMGTRPPMSETTATLVLLGVAIVLVAVGMAVFSRKEYVASEG
jgi:ABC-type transport system involved in multi-copper enzyme maturation permease subunit